MRMRFRTDGWHFAEYHVDGVTADQMREWHYSEASIALYLAMPAAEPGDTWEVHWWAADDNGPVAGYAICCPKCKHVHAWTTALNCAARFQQTYKDDKGVDQTMWTCPHSGTGSCWQWTGSAVEGTLTAQPSLHCTAASCGWHGWLTNGELLHC